MLKRTPMTNIAIRHINVKHSSFCQTPDRWSTRISTIKFLCSYFDGHIRTSFSFSIIFMIFFFLSFSFAFARSYVRSFYWRSLGVYHCSIIIFFFLFSIVFSQMRIFYYYPIWTKRNAARRELHVLIHTGQISCTHFVQQEKWIEKHNIKHGNNSTRVEK